MLRSSRKAPRKGYRARWARLLARPCGDDEKYPEKCTEPGQNGAPEGSGGLTEHDHALIKDQARLQNADSPEQVAGLARAWGKAKRQLANDPEAFGDSDALESMVLDWARDIEPQNARGYRKVPVRFDAAGTRQAVPPDQVPGAMKMLFRAYSEQWAEPDELYLEFEKIHPFGDGNGRVGDLLWKVAKVRAGEPWPNTHPPDFFGTDKSEFSGEPEQN